MVKHYIIENWLVKPAGRNMESITRSQIQQARARALFAIAGMIYLFQHAVYFDRFRTQILVICSVYLVYNVLAVPSIKRTPLSASRTLFSPLFDTFVVCFGMMADGGHSSGMFYILFIIIIGNSFRFGNALMIYTQILAFLGLGAVSVYLTTQMQVALDNSLLAWQLFGLLSIPFYVYLIRERAEEAMRGQAAAEEVSINLLDQGPLPVFTYDLDEKKQPRILYANVAINKICTDECVDLIGKRADSLTLPEDGGEMLKFCVSAFSHHDANPASRSIYIRGRGKSGNILRLICHANRLRWHDQWIGICFILDITERETLQMQLDVVHRQGFMSTLVAGIVHDFRNVLTNMIGYAEVLHVADLDEESKKQLEAIIDAGERGSELITHLLKLSKENSSDSFDPFTKGADLAQPLENIIGLARMQLPSNIQLHYDIVEPLHDVAISIIEIEQILLNLIHNATHAIQGKGQIRVQISCGSDDGACAGGLPALCIRVDDTGSGIAKDDLDNIFTPFWTTRGNQGGSGLGLTMIQRIVKLHHGSIDVQSEVNKGSSFTIHLPSGKKIRADKPPLLASGQKKIDAKSALSSSRPCHILLVEDAPDILKVHQALLSRMGHTTCVAEHGAQALGLFLQNSRHFDMIITDYRMPVMSGLELIEAVRQHDANIPILLITAFGEDEALQRANDLGASIINKPVSFRSLQEHIAHALNAASSTDG
jgi:signal transduction histidine kinase/CheY-like chemotaxis protein